METLVFYSSRRAACRRPFLLPPSVRSLARSWRRGVTKRNRIAPDMGCYRLCVALHLTEAACLVFHAPRPRACSQRQTIALFSAQDPHSWPRTTGSLANLGLGEALLAHQWTSLCGDALPFAALRSQDSRSTRRRVGCHPRCCADQREEGNNDSAALLRAIWRAARTRLPPLITGAGGNDGDNDPAAALFNIVFIRVPFLLACAVLVANVLLGGGVVIGSFVWPLVGYDDGTGLSI